MPPAAELLDPVDLFPGEFLPLPTKRQSVGERRRSEVIGQHLLDCASGQGKHCYFNLKVIFEPFKTGKRPACCACAGRGGGWVNAQSMLARR